MFFPGGDFSREGGVASGNRRGALQRPGRVGRIPRGKRAQSSAYSQLEGSMR